jgi:hypothetical protein
MAIEEEQFYPPPKSARTVGLVRRAVAKHALLRVRTSGLVRTGPREAFHESKVERLGEATLRHMEKEDRLLLDHALRCWPKGELCLADLARQMRDRRQQPSERLDAMNRERRSELTFVADAITRPGHQRLPQ